VIGDIIRVEALLLNEELVSFEQHDQALCFCRSARRFRSRLTSLPFTR
jgi:hypothetical protein